MVIRPMASQGRSRRTYTWSMSKKKKGASRTPVSKEIQIVSATNGAGLSRETTFKLVPDTTAPTVTVQSADVAVGRIVVKAEDNTPGAGVSPRSRCIAARARPAPEVGDADRYRGLMLT